MDISRPCQPEKLIPLLPWPGFDPSFSGHNDRRAIISEWTWLRLRTLSHRGWLYICDVIWKTQKRYMHKKVNYRLYIWYKNIITGMFHIHVQDTILNSWGRAKIFLVFIIVRFQKWPITSMSNNLTQGWDWEEINLSSKIIALTLRCASTCYPI